MDKRREANQSPAPEQLTEEEGRRLTDTPSNTMNVERQPTILSGETLPPPLTNEGAPEVPPGHTMSEGRNISVVQVPTSGIERAEQLRAQYQSNHAVARSNGNLEEAEKFSAAATCASFAVSAYTHAETAKDLEKPRLAGSFEHKGEDYLDLANKVVQNAVTPGDAKNFVGGPQDRDWQASLAALTQHQMTAHGDDFKKPPVL